MLCGKTPFPSSKLKKVIAMNKECDIKFTSRQFKNYSENCMDLLTRMLEKDPDKRISSKEALQHKYFFESSN